MAHVRYSEDRFLAKSCLTLTLASQMKSISDCSCKTFALPAIRYVLNCFDVRETIGCKWKRKTKTKKSLFSFSSSSIQVASRRESPQKSWLRGVRRERSRTECTCTSLDVIGGFSRWLRRVDQVDSL